LGSTTGYDFLSELPDNVQEAIESRSDGLLPSSALLLADENFAANSISDAVSNDLSIGQKGFSQIATTKFLDIDSSTSKSTSGERCFTEFSGAEINVIETGIIHSRLGQDGILKVSSFQTGFYQGSSLQDTLAQISPTQIDILKNTISQRSTTEVGFPQINTEQSSIRQVGSSENNSSQTSVLNFDPSQIQFTKISLSSSITSQQLFSANLSHTNTSLLNTIYSTARSIWHTNTDLNLNFEITNLPAGQLAEATITGYNNNGRPNTATITLDDDGNGVGWFIDGTPEDGNGVGWFIDGTPEDNSEFRAGSGGDYFTANPDSAAYGKYDLLTTILHEMGHTLGIISGYSEFDRRVKGNKFVTASGTEITLTPDGSHLDSTLYPYDLMNTTLKTGVRKLPSAMDWATIDGINAGFEELVSRLNY
jgi:hypothetical protein